ncbi:MAG: hypothetical protein ACLQFR_29650 [Streptosporangiaceae bacterium]
MPRTARLTDALRGRRTALAALGAAAALAGAGTASAATLTTTAAPAPHPAAARPRPHAGHAARSRPARAAAAHPARPARPYQIYDSVTPAAIPARHVVATYATGGYAVSPAAVTGRKVLWIDTNGSDPRAAALDIEPGDATPAGAAAWTRAKLTAHPAALARLYTMRSEWPAVQAAVRALPAPMQTRVRWWIADPTGTPHQVPGAQATQWYWGPHYDITTATPAF